jgi:D-sedoheptulose 7-phosphate isomerase
MGMTAAALTGGGGGFLVGLADPLVVVPAVTTARIQELHLLVGHMLCAALEEHVGQG